MKFFYYSSPSSEGEDIREFEEVKGEEIFRFNKSSVPRNEEEEELFCKSWFLISFSKGESVFARDEEVFNPGINKAAKGI